MIRQMNPVLCSMIVTLLLTNFISTCSKNEDIILDDDTFVEVLADLMIIEKVGASESERIHLANQVFEKHKIDTIIFNKTRRFYESDETYWIKIYSKVKDLIQTKIDSIDIKNRKKKI